MCALGPAIRGQRIALEPTRPEDLDTFRRWFEDVEITRYLLHRMVPSPKAEQEWFDRVSSSNDEVVWRLVVGGETIGNTGIHGINWLHRHGATGLMIGNKEHWGKGYASEAVRLRTAFAFQELGLERLESESFADNVRMHRALEKGGYTRFARRRHYLFRDGTWHDSYLFESLRDEWLEHMVATETPSG